jgi:hypothetical protein
MFLLCYWIANTVGPHLMRSFWSEPFDYTTGMFTLTSLTSEEKIKLVSHWSAITSIQAITDHLKQFQTILCFISYLSFLLKVIQLFVVFYSQYSRSPLNEIHLVRAVWLHYGNDHINKLKANQWSEIEISWFCLDITFQLQKSQSRSRNLLRPELFGKSRQLVLISSLDLDWELVNFITFLDWNLSICQDFWTWSPSKSLDNVEISW